MPVRTSPPYPVPDRLHTTNGESAQCPMTAIENCVNDNPVSSTLVAVGTGFAFGLMMATLFRSPEEKRSSYFSELGRQLQRKVVNSLPESVWNR